MHYLLFPAGSGEQHNPPSWVNRGTSRLTHRLRRNPSVQTTASSVIRKLFAERHDSQRPERSGWNMLRAAEESVPEGTRSIEYSDFKILKFRVHKHSNATAGISVHPAGKFLGGCANGPSPLGLHSGCVQLSYGQRYELSGHNSKLKLTT